VKRAVFTLILIFILSGNLLAEEETKVVEEKPVFIPAWGFGLGFMYQFNISLVSSNNYYCFRHYGIDMALFYGESYIHETAFLYGKTINFNTKTLGYLAFSAGPSMIDSYLNDPDDDNDYVYINRTDYGLATDINFTKGITNQFGYGFNITANLNQFVPFGGFFFSLYLGDFTNYNYDPIKVKPRHHAKPSAKIIDNDKINETEQPKEYVSIDFNFMNYLFLNPSYKFNICWEREKTEWVIPVQYRKTDRFEIYERYDELTIYGLKSRNYMGNHGWYFDLGMDVYKFHDYGLYDNDIDKYDMLYNIAVSLGNKAYLSDHFYIRNQLNMHIPIGGDEVDFDGYGLNSGSFIMDFEFIVLGLTF